MSYTEERRRQELLESKLLQDYLQRKDLLDIAKDQVTTSEFDSSINSYCGNCIL